MTTTPEQEKEEARKRRNTAIGLMGAGAGLGAVSQVILNEDSARRVNNLTGGYNAISKSLPGTRDFGTNHQILRSYGEAGHEALGAAPLGMTSRTFVEKVRSLPIIPKADRWKGEGSALHYDAFKQGPLYGYLQMLTEDARKNNTLGKPQRTEKFLGQLMDRVNEQSRDILGRDAVETSDRDFTKRLAWGRDPLPVAAQRQILDRMGDSRSFSGWLSPRFHGNYRDVLAGSAPGALQSYKKYGETMGEPLLKAKNIALGGGLLLAGAGAGLGIHHLIKKLRQRKAPQPDKNRLASEPQIS